uniref:Uncharacterized protein n=1 Tax=Arundo donax TaxID=35708 RepID=A0A0A8YQA4_ARUDO
MVTLSTGTSSRPILSNKASAARPFPWTAKPRSIAL